MEPPSWLFQKKKTNWDVPERVQFLHSTLRQIWHNSSFSKSKSAELFLSNHQPGGTSTIVCGNWTSRLVNKGEDPLVLGRWTFVMLCRKGARLLTIVTVNNSPISSSNTSGRWQQRRVLLHLHRQFHQWVEPNPRRQFILDLQAWLGDLHHQGHDIILAMDANKSYDPALTTPECHLEYHPTPTTHPTHDCKLSTLVSTLRLFGPLAQQHVTRPLPASHLQGSQSIDYILLSCGLSPSVIHSSSLAFHSLFLQGDHRPYFIDLGPLHLFSDPAYEIERPKSQFLCLHDPKVVDQYVSTLSSQLHYHRVIKKVDSFRRAATQGARTSSHNNTYHTVNKIITELMLHSKKH